MDFVCYHQSILPIIVIYTQHFSTILQLLTSTTYMHGGMLGGIYTKERVVYACVYDELTGIFLGL
jgi:hypothetical protein